MDSNLPVVRVALLSMGGTIASISPALGAGVMPALEADDLARTLDTHAGVAVSARTVRLMPSASFTFDDVLALVREVEVALGDGAIGVVVTQGTDDLEEVAFALDLLVDDERPVVVTGAMRSADAPGADGPANLRAAVAAAVSPKARGLGTLVVMSDEIHAARYVRKTHSSRPSAFASPEAGPLGHLVEGEVRVATRVAALSLGARVDVVSPVALLRCTLGDDGRLVGALLSQGYRGLVVEGMGAGHVPVTMVEPLEELAREIPVVLASRTGSGSTLRHSYGFAGSEIDLLGRGVIAAGALDGLKARLALALALGSTEDRALAESRFGAVVAAVG
ncbi:MAG: asparaginase [Acidimicrobiales bacterium]